MRRRDFLKAFAGLAGLAGLPNIERKPTAVHDHIPVGCTISFEFCNEPWNDPRIWNRPGTWELARSRHTGEPR